MKVIDLFDEEAIAVVEERDQNNARITSREGRKAAKQLSNENPQLGWDVITNCVRAYCSMNPAVRDIPTIVRRCEEQLKAPKPAGGNASASANKPSNVQVIDYSDYNEDEVVMHVDDSQDEVCVVSTTTPLLEVLRMFPNAKRDYVLQLLQKNAYRVDVVVQSMLDKGYEKEEAASSSSSASAAPAVDYTSSSWETSAAYRKDALSELQRNFPFLTPASIALYFKREKHHFYHALVGIEKVVKIPALQFTQSRAQNVVATLTSGTSSTIAPAVTTTANTNITSPGAKAGSTSASKSDGRSSKAGAGPVTIDLMDSQPPIEVEVEEVSGPRRTSSRTSQQGASTSTSSLHKRAASLQAVDLLSPGSNKKSRRTSASPPKCLNKEQRYELYQRCDKDATGLVLKSSVQCTYTAVEDNISYLMQPLDSTLAAEIQYIHSVRIKEMLLADQLAAERLNEELATSEGSLMECGCCYGEYAFEALVQCSEGHLFCKTCLQRYCEQTVFGNGRSVIKCMNTAEVCTGFFSDTMLRHSLSEKVFEKFNQALSRDALSAAHMEGLVTCCHCSVPMLLEEDAGNVLHCPYCDKETCRLCGEPSHVPLRCSEVEKKGDTSARLSVEEAMTQARLRECHKCKTRFYKTEGCNKMTCRCGAIICYICRQDISKTGYQHFCQTAHCTHAACKKCRLFTDTLEDDRVAMKEAGLQTLQLEQQKQQAEGAAAGATGGAGGAVKPNAEKPGPKVDLDKLLEASNKPAGTNAAARAPAAVAVHPHMHYVQQFHPAGGAAFQFPGAAQFQPRAVHGPAAAAMDAQRQQLLQQQQAARVQQQLMQEQMRQQQQLLQQQVRQQQLLVQQQQQQMRDAARDAAREAARQQKEAQQEQRRAATAARKAEAAEAKRAAAVQRAADAAERNRQAQILRVRAAAAPAAPQPAATSAPSVHPCCDVPATSTSCHSET